MFRVKRLTRNMRSGAGALGLSLGRLDRVRSSGRTRSCLDQTRRQSGRLAAGILADDRVDRVLRLNDKAGPFEQTAHDPSVG